MLPCIVALGFGLALGQAADPTQDRVAKGVAAELPSLVSLYKHFHANPELSFMEVETAKRLAAELRDAGLAMLYVGAESGDDEVLERVNKGESYASTADALHKAGEAGLKRSVMILNGLGGSSLTDQHADNSARLVNETQPEFVSTLVVSFPQGMERFQTRYPDFTPLTQEQLFHELQRFVGALELDNTTFRSDHASNALVLKGELGRDKAQLLGQIEQAIARPQSAGLRPEWMRGL